MHETVHSLLNVQCKMWPKVEEKYHCLKNLDKPQLSMLPSIVWFHFLQLNTAIYINNKWLGHIMDYNLYEIFNEAVLKLTG